jgi:hypothetical protein
MLFLELIRDISSTVAQYMSTVEKPIYAGLYEEKKQRILPPGFINERVNMSDWEGTEGIGEVFYGSCFPEAALLLTIAELGDILIL